MTHRDKEGTRQSNEKRRARNKGNEVTEEIQTGIVWLDTRGDEKVMLIRPMKGQEGADQECNVHGDLVVVVGFNLIPAI